MSMDALPGSLSRMQASPEARLRLSSSGSCRKTPRPASTHRAMTLWTFPATPGTTRRFLPSSRLEYLAAMETAPSVPTNRSHARNSLPSLSGCRAVLPRQETPLSPTPMDIGLRATSPPLYRPGWCSGTTMGRSSRTAALPELRLLRCSIVC